MSTKKANPNKLLKKIKNVVKELNDIKDGKIEACDLDDFLSGINVDAITTKQRRLIEIEKMTQDTRVDLTDFKFDRNEANDYNE